MTFNNKILPVALAATLLGGSVGALVMHSTQKTEPVAATTPSAPATSQTADTSGATNNLATDKTTPASSDQAALNSANSTDPQATYRNGFADGLNAAREKTATQVVTSPRYTAANRTSYGRTTRVTAQSGAYDNSRRVYYDYNQPRKRSFWQKHRDKLTVAAGTGGGALLGGIIGGKKGAAIGAIAGGGGSALYTYKIRKKDRRY